MVRVKYKIDGMNCQSCVARIRESLEKVEAVSKVQVSLEPPIAEVDSPTTLDRQIVADAISRAGDYQLVSDDSAESTRATANARPASQAVGPKIGLATYRPLLLVVGFILLGTVLLAQRNGGWNFNSMMNDFMGLFFVAFSFFKLLNLQGFVDSYQMYDLIAKRSKAYAYLYPFIELTLGVCYLLGLFPIATNLVTLILMAIGALGVWVSLRNRQQIRCACLGAVFELPMTTVTLVEDVSMALMAGWMLFAMS